MGESALLAPSTEVFDHTRDAIDGAEEMTKRINEEAIRREEETSRFGEMGG